MDEMSNQTNKLIERMLNCEESVKTYKRCLNSAECDLRNAITALGKHLAPSDAKREESFSIWVRVKDVEKLLILQIDAFGDYHISWRK